MRPWKGIRLLVGMAAVVAMVGLALPGVVAAGSSHASAAADSAAAVSSRSSAAVSMGEKNNRYFFEPSTVFVNVGGTVTWKNGTDAAHTVTSDSGSVLASASIAANGAFSHVFGAAGTFAYHCSIHPYMTGTVVVLAANATQPPTDTLTATGSSSNVGWPAIAAVALAALLAAAGLVARRRVGDA